MEIPEKIRKIKVKKIFLQYPEGLKLRIQEISKELEKEGFEVVICCEPTFGACDIRDEEAKRLGCNAILHIGHSDFGVKSKIPVFYWDYFYTADPTSILEKEINKLKDFEKIGLVTSLQFVKVMERVKEILEKIGKKIFVNKGLAYSGQVLGCNVNAAKNIENEVDCFLFVGAGKFHPLGIVLSVEKPVFSLDLEKGIIYNLEEEKRKWMKNKLWHDAKLLDAKKVGIIICWKQGQNKIEGARKLKKTLENSGKEVYILAFDRITNEKLEGLKFDCLVNMACPRLEEELI
jgi:2-(3-amino-3-carboxypropyl)histidine synthase